jgi:hypothetical protein
MLGLFGQSMGRVRAGARGSAALGVSHSLGASERWKLFCALLNSGTALRWQEEEQAGRRGGCNRQRRRSPPPRSTDTDKGEVGLAQQQRAVKTKPQAASASGRGSQQARMGKCRAAERHR